MGDERVALTNALRAAPSRLPFWAHVRYRFWQGFNGLLTPLRAIDDARARDLLPLRAWPLFRRMNKPDRAHSLRVCAWLQTRGHEDPDLLIAALLHDCGKAAVRLGVGARTLKVLLQNLAPAWWSWLARPANPGQWRYPFFVLKQHPLIGAAWAEQAGCSPTAVWLIRHHESEADPDDERTSLLRVLQAADAAN